MFSTLLLYTWITDSLLQAAFSLPQLFEDAGKIWTFCTTCIMLLDKCGCPMEPNDVKEGNCERGAKFNV